MERTEFVCLYFWKLLSKDHLRQPLGYAKDGTFLIKDFNQKTVLHFVLHHVGQTISDGGTSAEPDDAGVSERPGVSNLRRTGTGFAGDLSGDGKNHLARRLLLYKIQTR